jgi:hypothetical protein
MGAINYWSDIGSFVGVCNGEWDKKIGPQIFMITQMAQIVWTVR